MKNLLIFHVLALTIVMSAIAADDKPVRRGPPRLNKPSGGIVEKQMVSKVFRILNTTAVVPQDKINGLTLDIRYSVLLPIEVVCEEQVVECPFSTADKLIAQKNVGAGVLIVDNSKFPIIVVSPDRKWAIMNIYPLKEDSPTPDKLFERFTKVYWNAIARTLGAGYSSYPGCVLVPFTTVAELDAVKVLKPCPEPFNKMIDTGNALGIKTLSIASYRSACEKGWAPAPTNDVQKAILDEVHAIPTEPIKIKP